MALLYGLHEKEYKKYLKFKEAHKDCDSKIWINIEENEIADTITVKCSKCKKKKDITDYNLW